MANKVYDIVTDQIIEMLEEGTVPWHRPWTTAGGPHNLISKKPYRGINVFMLEFTALKYGYDSGFWCTYKQAKKKGGQVRKGEKATLVIYWRWIEKEDKTTGETVSFAMLRYYRVFNVDQCDWPDDFQMPVFDKPDNYSPIEEADRIINEMPDAPPIEHKGSRAYYTPSTDEVTLPPTDTFESTEAYYSTAFHELAHATGHPDRLGRFALDDHHSFGSNDYSKEELVAEMGAAMLCGTIGIEMATINNSAAYIANWLRQLRDDKRLVVQAAGKAQKAADCIRGISW